jgi:DNA-binding cell septation regulator SpoVG
MNRIAEKPQTFNHIQPTTPYHSIAVTDLQLGEDALIATCNLKVGGLLIHHVKVRRGRNGIFVNLPSIRINGHWIDAVEITSAPLRDACRQVVLAAVTETTR